MFFPTAAAAIASLLQEKIKAWGDHVRSEQLSPLASSLSISIYSHLPFYSYTKIFPFLKYKNVNAIFEIVFFF